MTPDGDERRAVELSVADWVMRPLGEVAERSGTAITPEPATLYREIGIRSHGKGIFHKEPVIGATLGAKRVFAVEPGRLVFNIVFAWEGAVAVTSDAERGMIASHRFPMLRPTADRIDVDFLRRFFQTRTGVRLLGEASPGGAGRNRTLNQKFLAELPVPVPPLGEQRKIAAILTSMDDAIEASRAVIHQLAVVKKAMMAELLTRGLPGRHTRFKQTTIGEVPEEWEVGRVGDLGEVKLGRMRSPVYSSGTLRPYLRVANILDGEIDSSDVLTMPFEDEHFEQFRLKPGDILLNEGQSLNLVGRSAIYRGDPPNCGYQKTLLRFRPDTRLDTKFTHATFQWLLYSGRFAEHAVQTTSIAHLTGVRFSAMLIAVPPIDEQQTIARVLSSVDDRVRIERLRWDALTSAKMAMMSVLLTGEVRVTPDDEAAA